MLSLFYAFHKSLYDTIGLLDLLQSSLAVAWYWLSTTDVPFPLGSRTVSGLRYQLLTATAYNDRTAAVI
jgi:hypothetical protein